MQNTINSAKSKHFSVKMHTAVNAYEAKGQQMAKSRENTK